MNPRSLGVIPHRFAAKSKIDPPLLQPKQKNPPSAYS